MVKLLAFFLVIVGGIRAFLYSKSDARKRCLEFLEQVKKNRSRFVENMPVLVENKSLESIRDFMDIKGKSYLIRRVDSQITVHSLNNSRQQTMFERQYSKLEKKLNKQNPTYTYSIDSNSIFYRLPSPYEDYVLRIDS